MGESYVRRSGQYQMAGKRVNEVLGQSKKNIVFRTKEVIVSFYHILVMLSAKCFMFILLGGTVLLLM